MQQKHRITWRFHKEFPKELKEPFLNAFVQAKEMWEKSGNLEFWWIGSGIPDFFVTYELVGKEYGDITKLLYSPKISYRTLDQDVKDTSLIINCIHKWKYKWYHFFREEFNPIEIAHNLGHVMGLCLKKHVKSEASVMYEQPTKPPTEGDFQILRIALSKQRKY